MSTRIKITLILGVFFALIILLKCFFLYSINDQGFLVHISSEILGAIIILWVVDYLIKKEEERQQKRLFEAAIRSLKNPLRRYINMWLHISNSNEDELNLELQNSTSVEEYLLSITFINKVRTRSFNERYTDTTIFGSHDNRTLKQQVPLIQEQFMADINRIIGNYAHAFDPETIELLQHFAETAHLYSTFYFGKITDIGDNRWFQQQNEKNIKEHLIMLNALLDRYNDNVSSTEKWTKDNILKLTKISGDVPNVKW